MADIENIQSAIWFNRMEKSYLRLLCVYHDSRAGEVTVLKR